MTFANGGNSSQVQKVADIWMMRSSPLYGLDGPKIEQMVRNATQGNDVLLQQCFDLLEKSSPVYAVCVQKRVAGAAQRAWDIQPLDSSAEAKAQASAVRQVFLEADNAPKDNLTSAIEWLVGAAFKGRAAVKPFFRDGKLIFKCIQPWHLLLHDDKLWWNPTAEDAMFAFGSKGKDGAMLQEVPMAEVCFTRDLRPIDWPGISIYLRQLVGETKWAQFIERQGIPQIVVNAPEGTPDNELGLWRDRAWQLVNGGSGVLPHGTQVQELTSARGQDPFTSFCEHQMKLISILATGGTLATIGGTAGMGSNISEIQDKQFHSLVSMDCKKIQNALNSVAIPTVCRGLGQPTLCKFSFIEEDSTTPQQYLELAKMAKELGAGIDLVKLREVTKLSFISLGKSNDETELWQPSEVVEPDATTEEKGNEQQ